MRGGRGGSLAGLGLFLAAMGGAAVSAPQPCQDREILVGYLKSRSLALHSWGLTSDGKMQELFLSPSGNFVVAETSAGGCMRIIAALDKEGGRLWRPPSQNKAADRPRVTQGSPL